ncbi:hypothetical protein BH11GEM1_BH11GEM1_29720 [soil metagenome]
MAAVTAATGQAPPAADTAHELDNAGVRRGFRFGVATGALQYDGGRSEQTVGAVVRWAPARFFSLSASPTVTHQRVVGATSGAVATSSSGLTDIPVTATLSHVLRGAYTPVVVGSLGMTVPVGDTTGGFGAGAAGYSVSVGVGLSPTEATWMQAGLGHVLSGFGARSAFTDGSSWIDVGGGRTVTDRVSVDAGYSTDVGTADAATGRSSSLSAGMDFALARGLSINLATTRGLGGVAPAWSMSLGFGSAFPSLGHAAGGGTLGQNFGGGTHGLSKPGTTKTKGSGRQNG